MSDRFLFFRRSLVGFKRLLRDGAAGCLLIVAAIAAGYSSSAGAEVIANLYTVRVPVESQSASELKRASQDALAELFVRVSGQKATLQQPDIAAAVEHARAYTKQYSYEHTRNEEGEEQLQLVVEFEQQLVDKALREADVPLWSNNRPSVLVWLAVEDGDSRRFISTDKDQGIIDTITADARRRGLPLKMPLLDLQDMIALSPDDIWQDNFNKIDDASARYNADTILSGRVTHLNNGQWLGRWTYEYNGRRMRFDGEADDIDSYIAQAVGQVAESLAAEYAIAPVKIAAGGILMRLTNVNSFVDYAQAINYLEGVAAVHHANVVSINGDELIVRLLADGQLAQLRQAFALDKRLLPQASALYSGAYHVVLDYRWPSTAGTPLQAAPQPGSTASGSSADSPDTDSDDSDDTQFDDMDNPQP